MATGKTQKCFSILFATMVPSKHFNVVLHKVNNLTHIPHPLQWKRKWIKLILFSCKPGLV